MKALLREGIHPDATAYLEGVGIVVSSRLGVLDARRLSEALDGVQLLGIRSGSRVTRAVLAEATELVAVGGSTEEAQKDIGGFVADTLREYVETGSSALGVNLPQARFEGRAGSHRLAHLHANTPGVLATVNSLLAQHDVNVKGQALATRNHLGYLLTDVGTDYAPDVVQALNRMPQTVRLRVLS